MDDCQGLCRGERIQSQLTGKYYLLIQIGMNRQHGSSKRNASFANRREYNFDYEEDLSANPATNIQTRLDKMYQVPASFHKAHIHEEAYRFGYNSISGNEDRRGARCECCDHYVAYTQLDLCQEVEIQNSQWQEGREGGRSHMAAHGSKSRNLPVGVSLYFSFIKTVTWYLLIRFIVFDLYNMYLSMYGNYCSSLNKAQSSDLCSITLSGYNLKGKSDTHVLDLLNFAFTLISIAYFIRFKNFQEEQRIDARHESVNEEDFSVILENIPAIIYSRYDEINDTTCNYELWLKRILEKKIRVWLQTFDKNEMGSKRFVEKGLVELKNQIKKHPDQMTDIYRDIVKKVTICYDLTEIERFDALRDQLVGEIERIDENKEDEFAKLLRDEEGSYTRQMRDTTMVQYAPNQIKMINAKYIALCRNFMEQGLSEEKSTEFKLSHFTGRAIVTFQYQHFRDYLIREYEDDPNFLQINENKISIRRANKPSEIYWMNLAITDEERTTRSRYSWGVLGMFLIISFAAFLGLEYIQSLQTLHTSTENTSIFELVKRYLVTASSGILTTVINFALGWTIQLLAKMEKHKTKSERLTSLVSKMIVTQTINSSFIYLILYFIMPINPLGQYGLVNKVISIVIVGGFANVASNVLRPGDLWNRYKNRKAEEKNDPQFLKTAQIKLNQKYEMPKFGIAQGYASYIVIIFTVSFYGFIVPMATPIAIAVFFLQYWVDKYNMFRRSAPIDFGYVLSKQIFTIFEATLFFFTFGYFLWDLYIHYDNSVHIKPINVVALVISAQYAGFYIFVSQSVKNKIIGNQEKMYMESYEYYEKANKFKSTYFSENPATSFLKTDKPTELVPKTLEKKNREPNVPRPPNNY